VDEEEPERIAGAVRTMGLKNVVVTSVTRDDLEDGGSRMWAETIRCVHEACPGISVEVLIPDFGGCVEGIETVMNATPEILGHNLEPVPALYEKVRPQVDYERSLDLLRKSSHEYGLITKTGIMVGLGESADEVLDVMRAAREADCVIFYIGQYLQPTEKQLPVHRYVEPEEFDMYRRTGLERGFKVVVSGPLVRSSYYSAEQSEYVRRRTTAHRVAPISAFRRVPRADKYLEGLCPLARFTEGAKSAPTRFT